MALESAVKTLGVIQGRYPKDLEAPDWIYKSSGTWYNV